MIDHDELFRTVRLFARTVASSFEIGPVLYDLTDQVDDILDIDGAGFSLGDRDGRLRFVTGSDERVLRLEHVQLEKGAGPCRTAFMDGEVVIVNDLAEEERWPDYRAAALVEDRRAVLGVPIWADEQRLGALNLYRRDPGPWSDEEIEVAELIAGLATAYLLTARTRRDSERITGQLEHALESRIIVEQAKGVLVERHGVDAGEAFGRLRAYARRRQQRVHDVADAILAGEVDPFAAEE